MQFDLGPAGLGILVILSLGFGAFAQVLGRPGTRWQWLIAAGAWFIGGLVASEIFWGGATIGEIQPIIDGLAFDEAPLGGMVVGVPIVVATRYLTGGSPFPCPRPLWMWATTMIQSERDDPSAAPVDELPVCGCGRHRELGGTT